MREVARLGLQLRLACACFAEAERLVLDPPFCTAEMTDGEKTRYLMESWELLSRTRLLLSALSRRKAVGDG